jgi:hypothetical protein
MHNNRTIQIMYDANGEFSTINDESHFLINSQFLQARYNLYFKEERSESTNIQL